MFGVVKNRFNSDIDSVHIDIKMYHIQLEYPVYTTYLYFLAINGKVPILFGINLYRNS